MSLKHIFGLILILMCIVHKQYSKWYDTIKLYFQTKSEICHKFTHNYETLSHGQKTDKIYTNPIHKYLDHLSKE